MTSLIRFSPRTDMRSLQREIDSMFDNFFPRGGDQDQAVWTPRVDLAETEDAYLLHVDVPGMAKEELTINYQDGTLTITGERKFEGRDEKANFVRVERRFGHFYRSFELPKLVDAENIDATYKEGVLSITVPKAEESKPRAIKIK